MFNRYPYTDAHQLNLDWVIKQVKKIPELAASIPTKLSQLLNDTGFINAAQAAAAAPVQSVNGQTGDVVVTGTGAVDSVNGQTGTVVLTAADVGAKPSSYSAPVDSVNSKTGTVVLTASDVGALPSSYTAPVASVNGQTGAVVLTAADVGAKPSSYSAPVDSVNGQTGAVVLTASDVGALASTAINTEILNSSVTTSDVNSKVTITFWEVRRSGRTVMIALWFNLSSDASNGELLFKISGIQNALTITSSTFNASNQAFGVIEVRPNSDLTTTNVTSSGTLKAGSFWIFNLMFIMREGT